MRGPPAPLRRRREARALSHPLPCASSPTLPARVAAGNEAGFFRVVPGFVVQFGISGLPAISAAWQGLTIKDDPVVLSNTLGSIAFATAGPDTRTTQVYINLGDNSGLDAQGFAPFGNVTSDAGYAVVSKLYAGYGQTPDQDTIYARGDKYLKASFPLLDYTVATTISS